ncbi:hypothetical protein ACSSS7_001393 [Eimeria intestinalis]
MTGVPEVRPSRLTCSSAARKFSNSIHLSSATCCSKAIWGARRSRAEVTAHHQNRRDILPQPKIISEKLSAVDPLVKERRGGGRRARSGSPGVPSRGGGGRGRRRPGGRQRRQVALIVTVASPSRLRAVGEPAPGSVLRAVHSLSTGSRLTLRATLHASFRDPLFLVPLGILRLRLFGLASRFFAFLMSSRSEGLNFTITSLGAFVSKGSAFCLFLTFGLVPTEEETAPLGESRCGCTGDGGATRVAGVGGAPSFSVRPRV